MLECQLERECITYDLPRRFIGILCYDRKSKSRVITIQLHRLKVRMQEFHGSMRANGISEFGKRGGSGCARSKDWCGHHDEGVNARSDRADR